MQGVSVTKALGAGIAAVVAMFALWGALFAVQPAYAADATGLSAGTADLSAQVSQPAKKYVRVGASVAIPIKETTKTAGTWSIKVKDGSIATAKLASTTANSTKLTVTGKKAGTAKIEITFTSKEGAKYDTKTETVVVKGAAKNKVIVGATGIKYKVLDTKQVAVIGTTKAARATKTSVAIPDTVMIADNGKKINKTDSYNGPANYRTSYKVVKINQYALHQLTKVTSISIGNNVVSIGNHAFCEGSNLKKLTLGTNPAKSQLKTVGAFVVHKFNKKQSKNFKVITINSTKLTSVKNMLKYNGTVTTIKVPASKVKAYTKLFKQSGKSVKVVKK